MSILKALQNAVNDPDGRKGLEAGFRFFLSGDLHQMAIQEEFLKARGFEVGMSNVYPALRTEDEFKRALRTIWEGKVAGWWHYDSKYIPYGICTTEEFTRALDQECARSTQAHQ